MIYEYKCENCGYVTNVELSMNHPHPKRLPCLKCGEDESMYQLFNASVKIPFQFHEDTYDFTKRKFRKYHSFTDHPKNK